MAKKKAFTSSFQGFDYQVSVPSASFEGESASSIKDRIQEYLHKWYGMCYKELLDKFQKEFKIEVSDGKEADLTACYSNGWVTLDGSILQQINEPADDSKRIKFPVPGTEKFELVEFVVKKVLFADRELLQREIRDGWVKVLKELSPEEMIKSWEENNSLVIASRLKSGFTCEPIQTYTRYVHTAEKDPLKRLANSGITSLTLLELTEEGKVKFENAGFHKGPEMIKKIQKFVVDKQIPINLESGNGGSDHKEWISAINRGLLKVTEELTLKEIVRRGLVIEDRGAWKVESGWKTYQKNDSSVYKFVLLELTPKGQAKYNEGIEKVLIKEETNRIEGKTF